MKKQLWFGLCVLTLAFLVTAVPTEAGKKNAYTDPKEAGPDFGIQGEYHMYLNGKFVGGAQFVARGDGKFDLVQHQGGLPGEKNWKLSKQIPVYENIKATAEDIRKPNPWVGKRVDRKSPSLGKKAPQGAVILFDGSEKSAKNWNNGKIVEGNLLNNGVISKAKFKDFTLHMEFRLPFMPKARGQGRGNSGCYLQHRYEVQILDSFGLKGKNNECGGIYQQYAPAINMCFPPLVWQTYDIDFTAARFDESGKKVKNARATIKHNGVVIHDDIEFKSQTPGGRPETDTPGPIQLQNHGNPVYFRNIWVVEKK